MLDYIAIERADVAVCAEIGRGLARGAELADIEIPGGELAQLGDMVKGFDIAGACFGTVALDAIIDGSRVEPGDVVIGLPSSGIHSNGYTLARSALEGIPLEDDRLGRPLGEVLLEPTEIYVRAVARPARAPTPTCAASPTSPRAASRTCCGCAADVGFEIDSPLPVAARLRADRGARRASARRRCTRSSTWAAASAASCPAADEEAALEVLRGHYPAAQTIGRATPAPRRRHPRGTF